MKDDDFASQSLKDSVSSFGFDGNDDGAAEEGEDMPFD